MTEPAYWEANFSATFLYVEWGTAAWVICPTEWGKELALMAGEDAVGADRPCDHRLSDFILPRCCHRVNGGSWMQLLLLLWTVWQPLWWKQNCVGPFPVSLKTNFSVVLNSQTHSFGRRANFGNTSGNPSVTWKAVQHKGRCGFNTKFCHALEKPNTWTHCGFGEREWRETGSVWYS